MSIAADTVAQLVLLQNGAAETAVGFKARQAVRVARYQLYPGIVELKNQPTQYQACITQAIVNESNR